MKLHAPRETPEPRLDQLVDWLSTHRWAEAKSLQTLMKNANDAIDFFGAETHPGAISYAATEAWKDEMASRGLTGGTINRKLAALSVILAQAIRFDMIKHTVPIERSKEAKPRERVLTLLEEATLRMEMAKHARCYAHRFIDVIAFLLQTGCRLGECQKITWSDIVGSNVTFRDTKNGKSRVIPLTAVAVDAVGDGPPSLLRSRTPVFDIDWGWFRRSFNNAKMVLSDPQEIVPHTLRHTCASRMVQRGVELHVVSRILGHSSLQMTMRYAHLNTDSMRAAMEGKS